MLQFTRIPHERTAIERLLPPTLPPCVASPVRKYVAWSERNVKSDLIEMRLAALGGWRPGAPPPASVQILPLAVCGDEWLLRRVCNAVSIGMPGFRPARHRDIIAFAGAPHHDRQGVFMARAGDTYVGYCIGRCRSGIGRISGLAVHPDWQQQGVGRALLHATLGYFCERGAVEARLYVHPDNRIASRFYQREGFR